MNIKNFTFLTGFMFLIIGLLHITRIFYAWSASIGGVNISFWVSGVTALLAFVLCSESFRISKKQ